MTTEEAIAVYNEMADKYNAVMELYDLCDCSVKPDDYRDKPRIPLYAPDSTKKHSDLLMVYRGYYLDPIGVKLIGLIDDTKQSLEDLSLKKHGPRDAYYANGYVQLYTEELFNKNTGEQITDLYMLSYLLPDGVVDHTNGTTVDFVDNSCADLDTLDPAPDPSEFLESKVYPIINTTNKSDIDTAVTDAMTVFNDVAELPKEGLLGFDQLYDTYKVYIGFQYEYRYWVSDPQPDNPDYGYFVWYKKSDYEQKVQEIYRKVIACIRSDYNNWLNGITSTLQADLNDLMGDYTVISSHDAYVYEEKLSIFTTDPYVSYTPFWRTDRGTVRGYNAAYNAGLSKAYFPETTTYYYERPAVKYYMLSFWSSGPPTNPIDITADNECTAAYVGPISFKALRIENAYSNSDVYYTGFSYTWECGELSWYLPLAHGWNDSDIISLGNYNAAITYNYLDHITSITHSDFQIKIPPCTVHILGDGGINEIDAFPTVSIDYYEYIYDASSSMYTNCYVYNNTPHTDVDLNYFPEFHGVDISASVYITPHGE